jgi:hypothetical protein
LQFSCLCAPGDSEFQETTKEVREPISQVAHPLFGRGMVQESPLAGDTL